MPRNIMLPSAVAGAFLGALAFYPVLRLPSRIRTPLLALDIAALACAPLLVRPEHPALRFIAALFSVAWCVKLADLHIGAKRGSSPTFVDFVLFLFNPCSIVFRKQNESPAPSAGELGRRMLVNTLKALVAGAAAYGVFQIDWRAWPFFLEHSVKAVAFFVCLIPLSAVVGALGRLCGARGLDFMQAPLLATTPAKFWLRYNRPTQQFFYEDIFLPFGGLRKPLRGLAIVFILSALVHEILFVVILGKIQGYQTVFFLLQGAAVALTWRLRPRGFSAVVALALTWLFNLSSSMLFFASVNCMVAFYVPRG
jgi:hypothetical protein